MSSSWVFCKGLGNRYSNRLLIVAVASLKGGRGKALCLIALVAFVKFTMGMHKCACVCSRMPVRACRGTRGSQRTVFRTLFSPSTVASRN